MQVTPTGAFLRSLKRLSKTDAEDCISAIALFIEQPQAKSLNFERVKSRLGYFTIRANYSVRILLKATAPDCYDIVVVGNHDYVYVRYFK